MAVFSKRWKLKTNLKMNRTPTVSRRKKKRIKLPKPSPFPIPIKSITGVPVSDKQWMYFTGYIHGHIVAVRHSGDMDYLYKMGFFGKGNLSRGQPEYNGQYRYTTIVSDYKETYPRIVNKQWYKNHLSWVEGRFDTSSEEESDNYDFKENIKFSDKGVFHAMNSSEKVHKTNDFWKEEVKDPWKSSGGDGHISDSIKNTDISNAFWNKKVKDPWENTETDDHISDSLEEVNKNKDFWNDEVKDPWESTGGNADFWNTENTTDNDVKSLKESKNIDAVLKSESSDELVKIENSEGDSITSRSNQTANYSPPIQKLKTAAETVISKWCDDPESSKTVLDPLSIHNEKNGDLFVVPNQHYDKNRKRKACRWRPVMKINPFPIKEYLQLSFVEAFFLCYGLGCLIVKDCKRNVDIKSLWKLFCDKERNFIPSYICYHYFRSKGWVPKSGLKFGCDYILYKVGPPFYHGSYSVIIQYVEEGSLKPVQGFHQRRLSWRSLCGLNRITEHVGKEVLICYVIKPKYIPIETFSSDYISQFKVKEILLSRWVSSQERQIKETEDIP